jgi:hypothetical protein
MNGRCGFHTLIIFIVSNMLYATTIQVPLHYSRIQDAINIANDGDTILVSPGYYYERINFHGKNIVVGSMFMISHDDGFIGLTTITHERDSLGSIVSFTNGETSHASLIGFTIEHGTGTFLSDATYGGGILIKSSSPSIIHNVISWNGGGTCSYRGGGIAIKDSSNPLIKSNTIAYNDITGRCDCICYFGGGIWIDSTSNPIIGGSFTDANIFFRNYADHGWHVYRDGSGPILNAQYNYWATWDQNLGEGFFCPPGKYEVFPQSQFDLSNCLSLPTDVGIDLIKQLPNKPTLNQNYPNPFNPQTTIEYDIPNSSEIKLTLFNILGGEVCSLVNERKEKGRYKINFDASNLPAGVYFYKLESPNTVITRKLILLK